MLGIVSTIQHREELLAVLTSLLRRLRQSLLLETGP